MSHTKPKKSPTVRSASALLFPILLLLSLLYVLTQERDAAQPERGERRERGDSPEPTPRFAGTAGSISPTFGGQTVVNGMEIPSGEPPPLLRSANKRLFYPDAVTETRLQFSGGF